VEQNNTAQGTTKLTESTDVRKAIAIH